MLNVETHYFNLPAESQNFLRRNGETENREIENETEERK